MTIQESMRRHPAGKGRPMPDDNVIPMRRRSDPPVPDFNVGPPLNKTEQTMILLATHTGTGMTCAELEQHTGWHHGSASSVLTTLHKQGKIARLRDSRGGQSVYVHMDWVEDRPTMRPGVNQQGLVDSMAKVLRQFYKPCRHDPQYPHETCKQCETRALLDAYTKMRGPF